MFESSESLLKKENKNKDNENQSHSPFTAKKYFITCSLILVVLVSFLAKGDSCAFTEKSVYRTFVSASGIFLFSESNFYYSVSLGKGMYSICATNFCPSAERVKSKKLIASCGGFA